MLPIRDVNLNADRTIRSKSSVAHCMGLKIINLHLPASKFMLKGLGVNLHLNKPKMAYSRDALLENSKRQERDKTRVRLERD